MSDDEEERPPARDRSVTFRLDPATYEAAKAKADARGSTISKVLRALAWMWAHSEGVPEDEDWPPELPDEDRRAKRRPRQK